MRDDDAVVVYLSCAPRRVVPHAKLMYVLDARAIATYARNHRLYRYS